MKQSVLSLLLGSVASQAATTATLKCLPNDIVLPNGTCSPCKPGMQPDAYAVHCVPHLQCQVAVGQINNPNGSCSACGPCQIPDLTFTQCLPDHKNPVCFPTCPSNQFQSATGCQNCPPCEMQDSTGKKCVAYPQPSHGQCLAALNPKPSPILCKWGNEIVDANGKCVPCGKCTTPNWKATQCLPDANYTTCMNPTPVACTANQVRNATTGICEVCPAGWQATLGQTTCIQTPTTTWIPPPMTWTPPPAPQVVYQQAPAPQVVYQQAPAPVTVAPAPVTTTWTPPPAPVTYSQPQAQTCGTNQYLSANGYCQNIATSQPTYAPSQQTYSSVVSQPAYAPTYTTSSSYAPSYSTSSPVVSQPAYTSSYPTSYPSYPSYPSTSSVGNYWLFAEQNESEEATETAAEESP